TTVATSTASPTSSPASRRITTSGNRPAVPLARPRSDDGTGSIPRIAARCLPPCREPFADACAARDGSLHSRATAALRRNGTRYPRRRRWPNQTRARGPPLGGAWIRDDCPPRDIWSRTRMDAVEQPAQHGHAQRTLPARPEPVRRRAQLRQAGVPDTDLP